MSRFTVNIHDVSVDDGTLNFIMSGDQEYGLDKSLVNALRRVLLTDIPTVAFRTDEDVDNKDIIMVNNQTSLHNEMLIHRVSMIPLYLEPETFMKNYLFECKVKHDTTEPFMFVTTNDLSIYPLNSGLRERLDNYHDDSIETSLEDEKLLLDDLSIVKLDNYDLSAPLTQSDKDIILRPFVSTSSILNKSKNYALITELKSSNSDGAHQELHFYGSPSVSTAREHARFQAVSQATYSYVIDEHLREAALEHKISSEGIDSDIEAFSKKFRLAEGERYFKRDNENEPNHYNFSIKSVNYYDAAMLFKKAIAILIEKCNLLKSSFVHLLQEKETTIDVEKKAEHLYHFTLYDQNHTLGNLIQSHVVRRSLNEDSILQLCGYKQPHPLEDNIVLHISINPNHEIIHEAETQKLQLISTFFMDQLEEIMNDLRTLLDVTEEKLVQ